MKVYILTLPGDDARRAPLLRALADQDLQFELFFGVDARNGFPVQFEKEIDRRSGRAYDGAPMTNGEFACALSHRLIYERIVAERHDGALVLEDDAIVHPELGDFIRAWRFEPGQIVLLDHLHAWGERQPRIKSGRFGVHRLNISHYNPYFNTGYLVSRAGAALLAEANTPVSRVADWPIVLPDFNAMAVTPRLVDHNDPETGHSHLRGEREVARSQSSVRGRRSRWEKLKVSLAKRFLSRDLSVSDVGVRRREG